MRWLHFWVLLIAAATGLPTTAQDNGPENVAQEFSGSGTTTTGFFKVQDRWEVRWNARQVVSVAVMASDGTIVTGAAGVLRGSLFVPQGGQYYLKISDGTVAPPASTSAAAINAPATNAVTPSPPSSVADNPVSPAPAVSWHLQVVQIGTSVASNQALTVYTPFFTVPDSVITPVGRPAKPPPPVLTNEQIQTVVTIKGDNAQGIGFLMRSADGVFVVAHLHLLAANPNIKIFTNSGAQITPVALKGAVDRDLALYAVQDDHYNYLPAPTDDNANINAGDQLIIPDIGGQTDDLLGKPGRAIGMSPERIDFNNAINAGSSGAPVILVKGGIALAVVTPEKHIDVSDYLAKVWPANPAPGAATIIPCYGLRLTGVRGWETYDPSRFLAETLFLKQFHQNTRCLDSYLNGRHHRMEYGNDDIAPDNQYYLTSVKLRAATDTYKKFASGADQNQRLDAARELLFDLESYADINLDTLQAMTNLYAYDKTWAQEEIVYRKALKKELDDFSNNIVRLDNLARTR